MPNKTIKPIETHYKGYRFRSRLEARWAVFFDEMGIKWDYEVEGYDLGESGWYLPDFYLKSFNCFCEIKPTTNNIDKKVSVFSKQYPTLLCVGNPGDSGSNLFSCCVETNSGGGYECCRSLFYPAILENDYELLIFKPRILCDIDWNTAPMDFNWDVLPDCETIFHLNESPLVRSRWGIYADFDDYISALSYLDNKCAKILIKAYNAAKSARFEHGENGISRVAA
jgi:hypothetical protein